MKNSFMIVKPVLTGSKGKESACNAGDTGLIPRSGRPPGEGNDNSVFLPVFFPVFLPGNSMDRESQWATIHGVAKSQTGLSD